MSLSKQYLNDPGRIAIIKKQREMLNSTRQLDRESSTSSPGKESVSSNEEDSCVNYDDDDVVRAQKEVYEMNKEIYWNEMEGKGNRNYVDRFIKLTIIEEFYVEAWVDDDDESTKLGGNFLVEDKNGDVITLQVCFSPPAGYFEVGTKFLLVDPVCCYDRFVRMKPTSWLRLDMTNAKFFIPFGRKNDMCRYCGEENAKMKCANCNHIYCSRECQVKDWKVLKHKLVCKSKDESKVTEKHGGGTSKKPVSIPTATVTETEVPVQDENDTETDEEELSEDAYAAKVTASIKKRCDREGFKYFDSKYALPK